MADKEREVAGVIRGKKEPITKRESGGSEIEMRLN